MEDRYVQYAKTMVTGLCEFPGQTTCERTDDERGVLLTFQVAKADMPRIVGKAGATVEMIRKLVRTAGMLENARVALKIADPLGGDADRLN